MSAQKSWRRAPYAHHRTRKTALQRIRVSLPVRILIIAPGFCLFSFQAKDSKNDIVGEAFARGHIKGGGAAKPRVWGITPEREEWVSGGGGETFSIVRGGHVMRCEVVCCDPRILAIDNFVTVEEAAVLRDCATQEGFHESLVAATRIAK